MQFSFDLDGIGQGTCRVLIERDALPAGGDLECAFMARAHNLRRYRTHRSFGRRVGEVLSDSRVATVIGIRNPRLVLDAGLSDRLAAALARLEGLCRRWSVAAAGGLAADGRRACALYSAATPFLPVERAPLPLVDPLPDLWIAEAGFLRRLIAGGGTLPGCGLETVIALRGYLEGRLALSLPELAAGIDGPLQPRDFGKLEHALTAWLGGSDARRVDTLMGPVDIPAGGTEAGGAGADGPDLADAIDGTVARASAPLSLSIVTRTRFERPHLLDRLLTSISRARLDGMDLEVLLSTDADEELGRDSVQELGARFPNLRLRLVRNGGGASSRVANLLGGLRAAAKLHVAVLDDDDYVDPFAFENLSRTLFLGAAPMIVAASEEHEEEWTETPGGRHVLSRSETRRRWPAEGWRQMFSGVNALPVSALIMPRERLLARLAAFDFRHDLSEDYALFLLMLTDPELPALVEAPGTFAHISIRGGGQNSVTMADRRPWVRDIALYLAELTGSPAVAGAGLWRLLADRPGAAGTLADNALADCRAELDRRGRQIRLMSRELALLRAAAAEGAGRPGDAAGRPPPRERGAERRGLPDRANGVPDGAPPRELSL